MSTPLAPVTPISKDALIYRINETGTWGVAPTVAGVQVNHHGINSSPTVRTRVGAPHAGKKSRTFAKNDFGSIDFGFNGVELRHEANTAEWEEAFRDTKAAAVTITNAAIFDQTGTHIDASAGPTITAASAGDFANFNTYGGATSDGIAGRMLFSYTGGSTDTDNLFPRRVKACNADQIDLFPDYCASGNGTGNWACAIADETQSTIFKVGDGLAPGLSSASVANTYEVIFSGTATASTERRAISGARSNGFVLNIPGNGNITADFNYMAKIWTEIYASTLTNGTYTANANLNQQIYGSDNWLTWLAVTGLTKAAALQCDNLRSATLGLTANIQSKGEDNAGCTSRADLIPGEFTAEGSLTFDHKESKIELLDEEALLVTSPSGVFLDVILDDNQIPSGGTHGNLFCLGFTRAVFATQPTFPGAGNTIPESSAPWIGYERDGYEIAYLETIDAV
ncbi:MAG: hypothetical protein GY719_25905 [bacterium]|nr:hypothetical protein [bacterium]